MLLLAVLILGGSVAHAEPEARVERIELNHVYDREGRPGLTQVIGWDFYSGVHPWELQGPHVRWWESAQGRRPLWTGERWEWRDERGLKWWAPLFHESWTQYDRELVDREVLPEELRPPRRVRR